MPERGAWEVGKAYVCELSEMWECDAYEIEWTSWGIWGLSVILLVLEREGRTDSSCVRGVRRGRIHLSRPYLLQTKQPCDGWG